MLGYRLRATRELRGLTQDELAELIGTPPLQINRYENDKTEPKGDMVARIAIALQVSADYLLGLTDDPSPYRAAGYLSENELEVVSAMREGNYKKAIKVIVNDV